MLNTTSSMRGLLIFVVLLGCAPDLSDDAIPFQAFPDISINLTLPSYNALTVNGGHKNISGGVRGIIIYRLSASTFYAFEQNCSYHPNDACATVEVHSSGLYMTDTCCGSIFDFNGNPTGGPAWRGLRQYETSLSGSTLTITDSIVQ